MNKTVITGSGHSAVRHFGKARRKTKRQRAWEYMRRNRVFRVGDVLLVLEMSENSLQMLLRQLVQAKYIKMVEHKRAFIDKKYKLVKNTGVVCPAMINNEKALWDVNIGEKVFIGKHHEG